MYNIDDTLVRYQDTRLLMPSAPAPASQRPAYYMTQQKPVMMTETVPIYEAQPVLGATQRIIMPQQKYRRTMSISPNRFNKTAYSMVPKSTHTKEEPIVKVSTTKQFYYPALYNEVEEHLEVEESKAASQPVFYRTRGQFYDVPQYEPQSFMPAATYYPKTNKSIQTGGSRSKKYQATYRPKERHYSPLKYDPIATVAPTPFIPTYTQLPVFYPTPNYVTYNPMSTAYTAPMYNTGYNSGSPKKWIDRQY